MFISAASHPDQLDYLLRVDSVLTGSKAVMAKWWRLGENSDLQHNNLLIPHEHDRRVRRKASRDFEPS